MLPWSVKRLGALQSPLPLPERNVSSLQFRRYPFVHLPGWCFKLQNVTTNANCNIGVQEVVTCCVKRRFISLWCYILRVTRWEVQWQQSVFPSTELDIVSGPPSLNVTNNTCVHITVSNFVRSFIRTCMRSFIHSLRKVVSNIRVVRDNLDLLGNWDLVEMQWVQLFNR